MLNIDLELTKTEGWKRNGYFYIPSEKEYLSGTFSPYENFNNYDQYVKRLVKLNEDFDCVGFGDYKTTGPGHYKTQMNYQCSKCKHVSLV